MIIKEVPINYYMCRSKYQRNLRLFGQQYRIKSSFFSASIRNGVWQLASSVTQLKPKPLMQLLAETWHGEPILCVYAINSAIIVILISTFLRYFLVIVPDLSARLTLLVLLFCNNSLSKNIQSNVGR